ncbi:FAD-binding protein [Variovorax guangxiensis]|uniref:electron transfer flavoprotein subunit alpha/FixB family protein n=1 Tax=Variovorax guangxiensis TaxID=1775474 RepID=UPI00285A565C|nr:FAD-binding protein [Variovorax guangxiensis]MDR6858545.1 electron transfer flavoprotein alpha subunit [Variovorax guangxiensis]
MTTLVLADHDNTTLRDATARAVGAALKLDGDVHVLVAGAGCKPAAEAAARLAGVRKVLVADAAAYDHLIAEAVAALVVSLAPAYGALLAPSTSVGRDVMPRVAALLDVMQISDMSAVIGPDTFDRPVFAGNVIETVRSKDAKKVITVRASAFQAVGAGDPAPIEPVAPAADPGLTQFVSEDLPKLERPELTAARIVVSGGRGVASRDNFKTVIEPLADKLGAAVGASRAAVDAGYAPNDWQVGQTGKIVAPDLYMAIGISGAIQHLAGMKDSRIIVAINNDAEAPIFSVADFGLVADLYQAVPELMQELAKA